MIHIRNPAIRAIIKQIDNKGHKFKHDKIKSVIISEYVFLFTITDNIGILKNGTK